MSEQKFISPKTPKAKLLQGDDPKKNEWESMPGLERDGKVKADLIAEPEAAKKGGDV